MRQFFHAPSSGQLEFESGAEVLVLAPAPKARRAWAQDLVPNFQNNSPLISLALSNRLISSMTN